MEYSKRLNNIPPYLFAGLEAKAGELKSRGVDLIDLGIADPDLAPVPVIKQALIDHLSDPDAHQYPSSAGDFAVREAIAKWFKGRFDVELDPKNEIAVVIGAKEGIANISRAFVNPGDEVGAPDPGYPVYANGAAILNDAIARKLPLLPENGFLPTLEDAVGVKLLYLNYPNNPTGAVADESFYKKTADFTESNPGTVVAWDAAYSELVFGGFKPPSLISYTRKAVEFHSLSKMMNVTGYRIGFAVGNPEIIAGLVKVKTQIDSGAPVFIQRAMADALATYNGVNPPADAQKSHEEYGKRKRLMEDGLKSVPGVHEVYCSPATFFIWAKVDDDVRFVEQAMEKGVILTPGSGFGDSGKGFIRAAVTAPSDRIIEAIERLS